MSNLEEVSLYGGNIRFIPVKLKADWMGNPKGSILSLNHMVAERLIGNKTAKLVKKKEDKGAKTKDIVKPMKDKMMKPVRQKRT